MMKNGFVSLVCALAIQGIAVNALAGDDFYGVVESRPEAAIGTWVIAGRSVEVDQKTELEEEHGPLAVGACAEVELADAVAKKIESKESKECADEEE